MMRMLDIQVTHTPTYNPRSNKVERLHRVLGDILRSNQTGPAHQWVSKIPLALFAYRTTVSNVTGVTLYQAMFGVNSRVPIDVLFPMPVPATESWPRYVGELQQRLQATYDFMRKNQKAAVARVTAYQSGRVTRATKVEVGDVVYYFSLRIMSTRDQHAGKKLTLLWTGPYGVKEKISDSLLVIRPIGEWAKSV